MCAFRTPWEGGSLQPGTSREWGWEGMCSHAHSCTHVHSPNIHRWRAGLFFVHGEKPTSINVGGWGVWRPRVLRLGCILWAGALSVDAKLGDSLKRRASRPAAFPGVSLLAPLPTCLQLWLRSPSSSPSCHSCQLLSFKAP